MIIWKTFSICVRLFFVCLYILHMYYIHDYSHNRTSHSRVIWLLIRFLSRVEDIGKDCISHEYEAVHLVSRISKKKKKKNAVTINLIK